MLQATSITGLEAGPGIADAGLSAKVRITTRAMWVDQGRLLERLHKVCCVWGL